MRQTPLLRFVIGGYTTATSSTTGGRPSAGGLALVTLESRRLGEPVVVAEAASPSFVIASADSRFVYAVLEGDAGAVASWVVGDNGPWRALGERPTGGSAPCHLALSPDGGHVVVASYGSGSLSVHPVEQDGSVGGATDLVQHRGPLGPVADRQEGPHAHQVVFAATGHLLSCDLGLDAVIAYELDAGTGRLSEVARSAFEPGTGPRHLAFSPDAQTAWVVGELSSTVTVCDVDGPRLTPVATISTRGESAAEENLAAEIVVTADGREVLVSNRGDDTVTSFSVEGKTLRLNGIAACGGHWPRFIAFAEDESRLLVANERSDSISVLARGADGWTLAGSVTWEQPTCLASIRGSGRW